MYAMCNMMCDVCDVMGYLNAECVANATLETCRNGTDAPRAHCGCTAGAPQMHPPEA